MLALGKFLGVAEDVALEHEVVVLAVGLEVAVAALAAQFALVGDGELRLVAGNSFQPVRSLPLKMDLRVVGRNLMLGKATLSPVNLMVLPGEMILPV